jgi:hypothetical protein
LGCVGKIDVVPDPEPTFDPAREEGARPASGDAGDFDDDFVAQETDRAASEAGAIGGRASSEEPPDADVDEAQRPLMEAGEGESEGFELSEQELIDNASHGDQHAARRAIEDAPDEVDDPRAAESGEADFEHSSEEEDDSGR